MARLATAGSHVGKPTPGQGNSLVGTYSGIGCRDTQLLGHVLPGDDLTVVHHEIRTGTRAVESDGPAVCQHLGEHRRHNPGLPQPGPHPALDHRTHCRVVHQPHRTVVHARERHPMTSDEPGEPFRRGKHHFVPGSE